ncbi:amp- ligase [Moniliophthora roreri MCA 2997]|uniref:Amp-ligase n=2 Tax=Moniliophthora roreri TaxID=221103 RepID=V2YW94_MONRO|nr:amp- ligase [Moniliophthora roreri MCA 2997]
MFRTHLTNLEEALRKHPSAIAFKIPVIDPQSSELQGWMPISYLQWALDIDSLARHWFHVLSKNEVEQGSVVALCLGGYEYIDVVQIYAISKAGYIPHVFSRLPGISAVKDLLRKSNTKVLIRSTSFKEVLKAIDDILVLNSARLEDVDFSNTGPIPALPEKHAEDTALIAHTSGSTSGAPKLVYVSYRWLDGSVKKCDKPLYPNTGKPEVVNWMGSICHMAQLVGILGRAKDGDCTIQLRKPGDLDELIDLVKRDILDTLFVFAPSLVKLLNASQTDHHLRASLARLKRVRTGGATLPRSAEDFAVKNNIDIVNVYGATEVGLMMISKGTRCDPSNHLHIHNIPGISYRFDPVTHDEGESRQSSMKLLELVVLSDSIDCPSPDFRRPDDGHFHTGDLWEQADSGGYIYRGRDDDWIKCENACRCDTSAIEENARASCNELIFDCVVVGNNRPSPVLFVEPKEDRECEKLREEIFRRMEPFNSQRLFHERIASPRMIVIVPKNELPRTATKGNIRRKVVEEMYYQLLDEIYV